MFTPICDSEMIDVRAHGDPGERVAGETLADVWPRVLEAALAAGRTIPTQYGETRELLNLVSVIRNPAAPVQGETRHPGVLGLTQEAIRAYYERLVTSIVPEGAPYSYGSRLRGTGSFPPGAAVGPNGVVYVGSAAVGRVHHGDQIEGVENLLRTKPDTRAAFITPWRPDEDGGKESGRPCLVGITFRAVTDGTGPAQSRAVGDGVVEFREKPTLHMTVIFRSHDLHGAYPLNLAACCLWLTDLSAALNMAVGTVTCMSQSAHIYERDYTEAQKVVAAHPKPVIEWDQRSTWTFEPFEQGIRATAFTPDGRSIIGVFEGRTAEAVMLQIHRSNLVTSVQHGLWLGMQLGRLDTNQ